MGWRRTAHRSLQPSDRRGLKRRLGRRRQHFRRRWCRQRAHRQVRQRRKVHKILRQARRRATSTPAMAATSGSTCLTTAASSRLRFRTSATHRRCASVREQIPSSTSPIPIPGMFLISPSEILKMRLDGTVLGKFGRAGRLLKEFGAVNSIDCRSENTLFVGELANLRVQKLVLH